MRYFVTIVAKRSRWSWAQTGSWWTGEEVSADLVEMDGTDVHSLLLGTEVPPDTRHAEMGRRNGSSIFRAQTPGPGRRRENPGHRSDDRGA